MFMYLAVGVMTYVTLREDTTAEVIEHVVMSILWPITWGLAFRPWIKENKEID